jgi:transposase-like protein
MSDTELLVKSEPVRRVEVFAGAGRRRSWTAEQKLRLVAESYAAGETVSAFARRHALSTAHAGRRCAACKRLSRRHQHAAGAPRACRPVRRHGRQGHGEPDLAQGEERLGRVERPLAGRRADRAAHSRRHRGASAARPQSDLHLAAGRPRRARGRPEGAVGGQSMGGESAEAWRTVLDDLIRRGLRRPEFLIVDGAPRLDKTIAAVWDGVPVRRLPAKESSRRHASLRRSHAGLGGFAIARPAYSSVDAAVLRGLPRLERIGLLNK